MRGLSIPLIRCYLVLSPPIRGRGLMSCFGNHISPPITTCYDIGIQSQDASHEAGAYRRWDVPTKRDMSLNEWRSPSERRTRCVTMSAFHAVGFFTGTLLRAVKSCIAVADTAPQDGKYRRLCQVRGIARLNKRSRYTLDFRLAAVSVGFGCRPQLGTPFY